MTYYVRAPYPWSYPLAECETIEAACQALRDFGPAPYGLDGCIATDGADCDTVGLTDDDNDALDALRRELC